MRLSEPSLSEIRIFLDQDRALQDSSPHCSHHVVSAMLHVRFILPSAQCAVRKRAVDPAAAAFPSSASPRARKVGWCVLCAPPSHREFGKSICALVFRTSSGPMAGMGSSRPKVVVESSRRGSGRERRQCLAGDDGKSVLRLTEVSAETDRRNHRLHLRSPTSPDRRTLLTVPCE